MKNNDGFIKGRIKSVSYAAKGFWYLLTTEHSIISQVIIGLAMTVFGFFMHISATEWMFQILAIGMIITAEALNTAIEEIADFIHPDYHEKIGLIKDIGAGAAFFAAIFAMLIGVIIYVPKCMELFF